jgi:hypothetical protein
MQKHIYQFLPLEVIHNRNFYTFIFWMAERQDSRRIYCHDLGLDYKWGMDW